MLTHEELMEKCQELRYTVELLLDTIRENDGIYDSQLYEHKYYMDEMIKRMSSLLGVYIKNRDNMSDADGREVFRSIVLSNRLVFALTWYRHTGQYSLMISKATEWIKRKNAI